MKLGFLDQVESFSHVFPYFSNFKITGGNPHIFPSHSNDFPMVRSMLAAPGDSAKARPLEGATAGNDELCELCVISKK